MRHAAFAGRNIYFAAFSPTFCCSYQQHVNTALDFRKQQVPVVNPAQARHRHYPSIPGLDRGMKHSAKIAEVPRLASGVLGQLASAPIPIIREDRFWTRATGTYR